MKSFFLLLFCSAFICQCYGQKVSVDQVPTPVLQAFKVKFQSADKMQWEMENDNEYEVEFKEGKLGRSASFDKTGKWLETETEISISELPAPVHETFTKQFAGFKIKEADKVEDLLHGNVYEVEIEKGEEKFEVLIDASGKVLKRSVVKDDEK